MLLDAHQDLYNERFGGEGFPDWAVYDDGLPNEPGLGWPANYTHPATSRAFDNLWMDREELWDAFAEGWKAVAERFHDEPRLMGYDLLNEPWPGNQWPTCATSRGCPQFEAGFLQPFFEHVIAGIREVDPDNVVWVEPQLFHTFGSASYLGAVEPIEDDELGYSWHNYCLPGENISGEDESECEFLEDRVFEQSEEDAQRLDAASLLSEWGASDNPNRLERMTRLADEYLVSWMYWDWKAWDDPTGAEPRANAMFEEDDDLSTLKQDEADHLVRTYPQATAGEPLELSFDPATADFHYRYAPRPGPGPTEIFVPVQRHYPNGYEVEVAGARVTSPPDAGSLTLVAEAGAEEVEVTVAARDEPRPAEDRGARRPAADTGGPLPATGGSAGLAGVAMLAAAALARRRQTSSGP